MKRWHAILILVILTMLFFHQVWCNPAEMVTFRHSDIVRIFSPIRHFVTLSWRQHGEWPLWNPYQFSGYPIISDVQSFVCYPTFFIQMLFLPPDTFFGFHAMLHFFFAGLFMFLFARRCKTGIAGATVAGIVFTFTALGPLTSCPEKLTTITWIPLIFLLLKDLLEKQGLRNALILGMVIALQFFAGYPQILYYTLFFICFYSVCVVINDVTRGNGYLRAMRTIILFLTAALVAAGLSAIQLLPSLELAGSSTRLANHDLRFSTTNSMAPHELLGLLIPRFLSTTRQFYAGPVMLFLGLTGFLARKGFDKRVWGSILLISMLMSLGSFFPTNSLLFQIIPGFTLFRFPYRILIFFVVALSLLSGWGADFLLRRTPLSRKPVPRTLTLITLGCLTAMILAVILYARGAGILHASGKWLYSRGPYGLPYEAHLEEINRIIRAGAKNVFIAGTLTTISLALLIILISLRGRRVMGGIVTALVVIFLLDTGRAYLPLTATEPPEQVFSSPRLTRLLAGEEQPFRYLNTGSCRALPSATALHHRLENAGGYLALLDQRYVTFTNAALDAEPQKPVTTQLPLACHGIDRITYPVIIDLLNITCLLSPERSNNNRFTLTETIPEPAWNILWPGNVNDPETIFVYRNPHALPRAFIVPAARVITDESVLLDEIREFDPRREVLLEEPGGGAEDHARMEDGEPYRPVAVRRSSPSRMALNFAVTKAGFLVLSELWHPGWQAVDNGHSVPVLRGNYLLQCIPLSPGRHCIELFFRPASWLKGRFVSFVSALLLCGLLLLQASLKTLRRRRFPFHRRKKKATTRKTRSR